MSGATILCRNKSNTRTTLDLLFQISERGEVRIRQHASDESVDEKQHQ